MIKNETFFVLYLILAFYKNLVSPDTYVYEAPILNVVIGECVTLKAITHFKLNDSEIVTWRKDMKPFLNENGRTKTMNGNHKTLSFHPVVFNDGAYYQVNVFYPFKNITEVTDLWLNVKGCQLHQKETVIKLDLCNAVCIDKCPLGWRYVPGSNSKCVQYFSQSSTWSTASANCQSIGGELVTIDNKNENEYIGEILQTAAGSWIGLNDRTTENHYRWNFQSAGRSSFASWGENEPSNNNDQCNIENCVQMRETNGKWIDLVCGAFSAFVCQVHVLYNETDRELWTCANTKCFRYFNDLMQWVDARSHCVGIHSSGRLAQIDSIQENSLVTTLLRRASWIGLNDVWEAGLYTWEGSGQIATEDNYINWDRGEPNDKLHRPFAGPCPGEDCVQIRKFSAQVTWHDLGCDTQLPYICEKIRDRDFSTGAMVAVVIGCLILLAMLGGLVHSCAVKHKRTAVKAMIKTVYQEDLSQRELVHKRKSL